MCKPNYDVSKMFEGIDLPPFNQIRVNLLQEQVLHDSLFLDLISKEGIEFFMISIKKILSLNFQNYDKIA